MEDRTRVVTYVSLEEKHELEEAAARSRDAFSSWASKVLIAAAREQNEERGPRKRK